MASRAGASRTTEHPPAAARTPSTRATEPPPGDRGRRRSGSWGAVGARTTRAGEAVPRNEESGPAHRQAAHSARATTVGGGPAPLEPGHGLGDDPVGRLHVVLDHPGAHPAPVEIDAHPAAHTDVGRQPRRDRVVEAPVDGRHVGHHPHDARHRMWIPRPCPYVGARLARARRPLRRCRPRAGPQRPRACFKSSAREVSSQVNSFSERPKCP